MIMGILGGMMGPMVDEAAVTGGAEFPVVPFVGHGLDFDGSQTAGVGDGRSGHAGEDNAGNDIGMAQAPGNETDQGRGEAEKAVGDTAGIHQITGQNEEGHRQKSELVDSGDHALGHGDHDHILK